MFGIFLFKNKTEDKDYPFKKDPKKPLKLNDEDLVRTVRNTRKMTYFLHYQPNIDKLSDEEKIKSTSKYWVDDISNFKKVRGIDNCYLTDDEKFYIKIITKEKDWFIKHF